MSDSANVRNRSLIFFLVLIIVCFAFSYWTVFQKLMFHWNKGDNSYCYLVIPIFIYLCWERKNNFHFDQFIWSFWGVPPLLLSILTLFAGEMGSVETLLYTGLWGCVTSVLICLYGWKRCLHLWFPLLILLFIVPMPPFINRMLTFKMKMMASSLSVDMMRAIGMSVLQNGNVIDLGVTKLQVVDACSGLRYIVSMFLMALLIGQFFVNGWWRKFLLVLMVYPLSIIINAGRIFITGIFSVNGYQFATEGPLHDAAGMIAFFIAGAVLLVVARVSMRIGPAEPGRSWMDPGAETGPVYKAAVFSVCIILLFTGSGWALKNMDSVLIIPQRKSFSSFPDEIGSWRGKKSYLSKEILDSLWADDYVNAVFTRSGSSNVIYLLIPYYEYQGTRHTAHAPQSCLLGGGWALERTGLSKVRLKDQTVHIGLMHLKKGNTKMLASYFFLQRGRVIVSPWWNKFYLMLDALKLRRTDGALVRVEILMPEGQDTNAAETILNEFIQQLWPALAEHIPE